MFNREYFTDDLLESLEDVFYKVKDDKALKDEIAQYLEGLNLNDNIREILDEFLTATFDPERGFFKPCTNPQEWIGRMSINLTGALYYFKHASNISYRKEDSEIMYNAILHIIQIVVAHIVNPERIIGSNELTIID